MRSRRACHCRASVARRDGPRPCRARPAPPAQGLHRDRSGDRHRWARRLRQCGGGHEAAEGGDENDAEHGEGRQPAATGAGAHPPRGVGSRWRSGGRRRAHGASCTESSDRNRAIRMGWRTSPRTRIRPRATSARADLPSARAGSGTNRNGTPASASRRCASARTHRWASGRLRRRPAPPSVRVER